MRNRKPLTSLVILIGASALVGCASRRVQYATSHGFHRTDIGGREYYCKPKLAFPGEDPTATVNCLSLAQISEAQIMNSGGSSAPATGFDPFLYRRVMIDGQEKLCSTERRCLTPAAFEAEARALHWSPPPEFQAALPPFPELNGPPSYNTPVPVEMLPR